MYDFKVTHVINNFKSHRYEICDEDYDEVETNNSTLRAHINQPIYPTVVISKPSTCSEYGSLEEPERPNSTRGYDKI